MRLPKFKSVLEEAEWLDRRCALDLDEGKAEFEIELSPALRAAIEADRELLRKLRHAARIRHVSLGSLVRRWLSEKVAVEH
jgi:hypothetical protein